MRVKYIGEGAAAEIPVSIESVSSIKNTSSKLASSIDKSKIGSTISNAYNTELIKENNKLK